ncbi:MAG: hypothetical protein Kow00124_04440 [Anaerolineae bacterium]
MQQEVDRNKVGLLTIRGELEKEGAVRHIHEAVSRVAGERSLTFEVVESESQALLEKDLIALLERGFGIVVITDVQTGELAEHLATQHEAVQFITVGYTPQPESHNVLGLQVSEDAAQTSAAAVAALEVCLSGELIGAARGLRARLLRWNLQAALIPFLAIITALVIGAIVIAAFDPVVWEAFSRGFFPGLGAAFRSIGQAYSALFEGAFGNPVKIVTGLSQYISTGDDSDLLSAIYPLMESLRIATPYIFAGLAVAFGFRCGLFNIGAEGQYFIGGLTSVFVGYAVTGLPWFIHLPLAILAGIVGGAAWAAIAGFLKARTGAHEVINTIMLNYIAYRLADYLLQVGGPMSRPGDSRPVSPLILESAYLPQFFPNSASLRINAGLFLALGAVVLVYWLLFKTTIGFEVRTVGANPRAARTAGISVERNFVLAMAISGGLAGLAGAHDILGVIRYMPNAFYSGYGFDSIALALLGKSHPVGVLLAALLFGFLRAGAQRMQAFAQVPIDIIAVLQGLIIIFIAAPELIRLLYRLRRVKGEGEAVLTRGWGNV